MIAILASFAATRALGFAIVVRDERRLDPARLARAWPPASRDLALVMWGALAVAMHFARTRRSLAGAAGGALAALAVVLADVGVLLVASLFDPG